MSVEELKEKVDYVSLLFRQIDRCCASKGEAFVEAVEHLRVLCAPFEDEEFLKRLKAIEEAYERVVSKVDKSFLVKLSRSEERYEMQYNYERAFEIFKAIIDLLNRKGVIIERLRVGKE